MVKHIGKFVLSFSLLGSFALAEPGLVNRDIWFLPMGGEFLSGSQLEYFTKRTTTDGVGGTELDLSYYSIGESLSYGIWDNLSLGAHFTYKVFKNDISSSSTVTTTGLVDPSFSLLYRIYNQNDWPFFLDASFALSPSFGKARSNNVLRGSTELDFALDFGQVLYDWSYKATLLSRWFSREVTGGSPSDSNINSRFDWGFKGALQYDFDPEWSANLELGLLFPGNRQSLEANNYEDSNYEFSMAVGPKYQFDRGFSAALNFKTTHENGVKYDGTKSRNFRSTGYGASLALDYSF